MFKLALSLFVLVFAFHSFSQNNLFGENKGQIEDQNGVQRPDVQYYLKTENNALFITDDGFSIQVNQFIDNTRVLSNRVDYTFENFNPTLFKGNNKSDFFETHLTSNGSFRVGFYEEVLAIDEATGIKIRFYNKNEGFKYDVIIPQEFETNYLNVNVSGAKVIKSKNGIQLNFADRILNESMPAVYSIKDSRKTNQSANYQLTDNGYCINFNEFEGELVIDPYIIYSTFYGGAGAETIYGIASDSVNNTYAFGSSSSSSNIATSGAYNQTFSLYGNMLLVKFNEDGQRIWGTYINSSAPNPRKVEIDEGGNIYLAGITGTGDNLSTPGAHQSVFGGDYNDTFLAKFNALGFPIWSTLYGGEGNDILTGLAINTDGVYLAGYTSSHTQIATPGSFQDTTIVTGWNNDAFLAKFDTTGGLQVATYIGGGSDDKFNDVKVYDNHVYAVGSFNTWDKGTPGAYLQNKTSNSDLFFTKFDENLNQVWGSYFTGNRHAEGYNKIAVNLDKIYITGYVNSDAGNTSYSTANTHKVTGENGAEVYIELFDTSGTNWIKGTFFGGAASDYPGDIEVVNDSTFALIGYTTSIDQIAFGDVHKNYYTYSASSWSLYNDMFVTVFDDSLEQIWGSYYGGEGDEFANDLAVNNKKQLLVAGKTTSQNGIAFGFAHQQFNGSLGTQPEGFIAVFDSDRDSVITDQFQSLPSQVCPKEFLNIPFETQGTFFNDNVFHLLLSDEFGDFTNATLISSAIGQSSGLFSYQLPYLIEGGNYKFRVDATSPAVSGVSSGDLSILASPHANFTYQIGVNDVYFTDVSVSGDTWYWNFDDASTAVVQNPNHIFNLPGMYNVSLVATNSTCSDTAYHQVLIEEIVGLNKKNNQSIAIYPNPSNHQFEIRHVGFEGYIRIETLDGKVINEYSLSHQEKSELFLEKGIYLISFIDNSGELIEIKKVIRI